VHPGRHKAAKGCMLLTSVANQKSLNEAEKVNLALTDCGKSQQAKERMDHFGIT